MDESTVIRATTVLCVRRDGAVAMAGDGQVTVGTTVMKHGAAKVRRLYHDKILAGFAGSAAGARADEAHGIERSRHRRRSAAHRGDDLYLYERSDHGGKPLTHGHPTARQH